MKGKRSYQQHCGLARALDVVGERWTLLIVRELLLGPKRYNELLQRLAGLTTNLLAQRLKEMEQNGLVEKGRTYRLTPRGMELEPVILELGRWGFSLLMSDPRPEDVRDPSWAFFSLKRRYRGGERFQAEFRVAERSFELTFTPEKLIVQERPAAAPDVSAAGTFPQFADWLLRGQPPALELSGDVPALRRALSLP